ncbi:MAG: pyruvate dehydrogenase (acetyl-transferring) E1 component subunit alpha [Mycoplasmataceae bacterium]|nr:pyruvate dehydrogenase (acetyl-transferring) E1 component subunit alpha [Mycoplasmataceae bacterium]
MKYKFIKEENIPLNESELYRTLDIDGNLLTSTYKQQMSNDKLKKGYEYMVLSRQQDTYMAQLQRQGRMLTFAPNFGEEALQVASAMALNKDDWFVPAFRSNASMLYLGVPVINQLYYWNGNEKGSKIPEGVNVLPINVPIATQCSHAAGIAYGMKLDGGKNISVSFIGNGGTSEGEFYEAMNIAGVHKWPTVFCINNNQWAISTPNHLESSAKTLAAKSVAAGIPSLRVDGNDLLASYDVMLEAADYARTGKGPILVEFVTWRQGQHTTSDNPRIYRTEETEKEHEKWEPFHRIEKYMIDKKVMTQKEIDKLWEDKLAFVKSEYQKTIDTLDETVDEVFDFTYETLDADLLEQKEEAKKYAAKGAK